MMPNLTKRSKQEQFDDSTSLLPPKESVPETTGPLTRQRSLKMNKEVSTTSMYAMFNN